MSTPAPMFPTGNREDKARLSRAVLERLDLQKLTGMSMDLAREQALPMLQELTATTAHLALAKAILVEILSLGPLATLLRDDAISEIMVNGSHDVYIERNGLLSKTEVRFRDDQHLLQTIERIVAPTGGRVDESQPIAYARLADGSRVSVVIPPLAVDGPCLCIRRFGRVAITARELVARNSLSEPMLALLQAVVLGRLNVLISGGSGSGKTTLLNAVSAFIPESERIVTIEDVAELQIKQPHVVRMETRPPDVDGKGAVRERQLLITSLRMRPDRIIVGEVRGEEAFDMLQAMNTGHQGSLSTLHANSPRDALTRVESMVSMAGMNIPDRTVRQHIASAINVIAHVARMPDGSRKVVSISEITGMEGEIISMQEIFKYERTATGSRTRVQGEFRSTGIRPRIAERLAAAGVILPLDVLGQQAKS